MLNYMVEKETNNKYTCAYCGKGLRIIEGSWPHWVRLDYDPKRNLCSKSCVDDYVKVLKTSDDNYFRNITSSYQDIKDFVYSHNIEYLVHFTQANNLSSIFENGILSVERLNEKSISYNSNDQDRNDGFKDGTFLSISFPNYKTFYKYRNTDYSESDYAVILLNPSIMWEKKCLFSRGNSASTLIKNEINEKKDFLYNNVSSLKDLFDKDNDLPEYLTTEVQAEVIVFDDIEVDYIEEVHFDNNQSKFNVKKPNGLNASFIKSRKYFSGREYALKKGWL